MANNLIYFGLGVTLSAVISAVYNIIKNIDFLFKFGIKYESIFALLKFILKPRLSLYEKIVFLLGLILITLGYLMRLVIF